MVESAAHKLDELESDLLPEQDANADALFDPFAGIVGRGAASEKLWLGKSVPRYTSYPPATAFHDNMNVETYREAIATIPAQDPISFYLHVPFCQKLCLYCACNTAPTQNHERLSNYLHSVHRELESIASISTQTRKVSSVHFGGGSPNMMSEKDIGMMISSLVRRFDLNGVREVSMELDPRLVTQAQAKILNMVGITRVSLGVQDFDPDVQKAIGRVQPFAQVSKTCFDLREAGINKINLDLMYGLPLQSPSSVADTARLAASLKPDRIALFSYAHVPQVKKHQRVLEQYILPGPHASLAMEHAAREALRDEGYVEIGMDHFALPTDPLAQAQEKGKLRRSFQGYTDDNAAHILGVGASSIGNISDYYFQNVRDTDEYRQRIAKDGLAVTRGMALRGEDKLRAAIIQGLMCDMKVNLETLCSKHNYSITSLAASIKALEPFETAGVIKREGNKITLASLNRMAVRVIASLFDSYERAEDAPVSRAV